MARVLWILAGLAFVGLLVAEAIFFWRRESRIEAMVTREISILNERIADLDARIELQQKQYAEQVRNLRTGHEKELADQKSAYESRLSSLQAINDNLLAEKLALEKAEAERKEAERLAAEKAEAERKASAKAEAEPPAPESKVTDKPEEKKADKRASFGLVQLWKKFVTADKMAPTKDVASRKDEHTGEVKEPEKAKEPEKTKEPEKAQELEKTGDPEKNKEPERVKCPNCGGAGTVEEDPSTCSKCGGTGKVTVLKRKYKHNGFYRTGVFKTTEVVEDCPLCAARKAEKKKCVRCQGTGTVEAASSDKSGD